tara:strand:+ start:485 stop:667 length:183 start_codon:yes stop_codon:yes gene_type:complete
MYDNRCSLARSEITDLRKDINLTIKRKINALEIAVWVGLFFNLIILMSITILIIGRFNNG